MARLCDNRIAWLAALALVSLSVFFAPSPARAQAPGDAASTAPLVFVIPVEDEFENALYLILARALREAESKHAQAIILDINSFGGRVDAAIKIRDALIRTKTRTIAYVDNKAISAGSFIAIATDEIVMGPNSSIGGALPITVAAEGARGADEKFISVFTAEMRKTAQTKGHPVDIAEGFCNPKKVIPGLKKEGEILTLTYTEATSVGLAAYQAATLEDLLDHEGLAHARVERFHLTPTDRLARILSHSAVVGILMLIGLGGIFLELKAPGFSLAGAVGVVAIALVFLGSYLVNLSGYMEWIFFVIGVVLLALEIFVIPGFGLAGVLGITLIVGSLFFAMTDLIPPDGFSLSSPRLEMLVRPALTLIIVLIALFPFLYVISRILPATPLYRHITLEPQPSRLLPEDAGAQAAQAPAQAIQPGDRGQAITDLFPSGQARFGQRRVEVLTEGDYINRNQSVVVTRVEGPRIYVQRHEA